MKTSNTMSKSLRVPKLRNDETNFPSIENITHLLSVICELFGVLFLINEYSCESISIWVSLFKIIALLNENIVPYALYENYCKCQNHSS